MVKNKLDILAIGVHPDDVELGCGATLLKHLDLGYKIGILDLTKGELGTNGSAELRLQEANAAKEFAGIQVRDNLGFADGFFINDKAHKIEIIKVIRKYQPDIILSNAIMDRHPDHGNASKMISEACFLSGLIKIETQIDGERQDKWRPKKVYNYIQDYQLEPDFVVDISDHFERKIEMVLCFKSQFYNPKDIGEQTPISSKSFLEHLRGRAAGFGRRINVKYAEGFTSSSYIGIDDITKIL
ncbi:MAG: bacillithiol biosynthesis deacetylase BshB1 [Saprospiraceae bacterium]|nr:bacillithiol biosynthesis deacetylase BshB1 [Bacteroidia bacterium]NNE14277.1 bacillithiol biosynthesis deacetylase BshB1 [Saprospiraceae bacterium]NNL92968.1 bacillithiol biosynthesis deacetylase BshB1 [Saprospiraceae bacterium]